MELRSCQNRHECSTTALLFGAALVLLAITRRGRVSLAG